MRRRSSGGELLGLLGTNAASFALLPDIHHEHHQRLGVPPALERWLPALMAAASLGLFVTRNHRGPRALIGGFVAAYYLWASSVTARSGERALAAFGFLVGGAAGSLLLPESPVD